MTTRAIVPNADGEGSLGTSTTKWGAVYSSDPAAGDNSGQVPTTAWVQSLVATVKNEVLQQIFPVGSIYTSLTDSRNPNAILGFGTWAAIAGGTALISAGTCKDEDGTSRTYTAGKTYGANYSQISVDELPRMVLPVWSDKYGEESGFLGESLITGGEEGCAFPSTTSHGYRGNTFSVTVPGASAWRENLNRGMAAYIWKRTS